MDGVLDLNTNVITTVLYVGNNFQRTYRQVLISQISFTNNTGYKHSSQSHRTKDEKILTSMSC